MKLVERRADPRPEVQRIKFVMQLVECVENAERLRERANPRSEYN